MLISKQNKTDYIPPHPVPFQPLWHNKDRHAHILTDIQIAAVVNKESSYISEKQIFWDAWKTKRCVSTNLWASKIKKKNLSYCIYICVCRHAYNKTNVAICPRTALTQQKHRQTSIYLIENQHKIIQFPMQITWNTNEKSVFRRSQDAMLILL